MTLPLPTSAEDRPTCFVILTGTQSTQDKVRSDARQHVLRRLQPFCSPVRNARLDPFSDEKAGQPAELEQARRELQSARNHFLNVRLEQAEQAARRAINLYRIHQAVLTSYREVCEAHTFLGAVLLASARRKQAGQQFKAAVAIDSEFSPDPADFSPDVLKQYLQVRERVLGGSRGSLTVRTDPRGAELVFDGKPKGRTPLSLKNLLPGDHYLQVRKAGFVPWDGVIEIRTSQITEPEIFLRPTRRYALKTSRPEETKSILVDIGHAVRTELVVLVRVDPDSSPEEARVIAYWPQGDAMSDEKTLRHFLADTAAPTLAEAGTELPEGAIPPQGRTEGAYTEDDTSVWTSWWFWTLVGAVVVSAAVTVPLVVDSDTDLHITLVR
jgi:hypothetical protein